jgi:hypothetical protein
MNDVLLSLIIQKFSNFPFLGIVKSFSRGNVWEISRHFKSLEYKTRKLFQFIISYHFIVKQFNCDIKKIYKMLTIKVFFLVLVSIIGFVSCRPRDANFEVDQLALMLSDSHEIRRMMHEGDLQLEELKDKIEQFAKHHSSSSSSSSSSEESDERPPHRPPHPTHRPRPTPPSNATEVPKPEESSEGSGTEVENETSTASPQEPQTEVPQTEAPQTESPETEPPQEPETEAPQEPETEDPETEAPQTETPETEAPQDPETDGEI